MMASVPPDSVSNDEQLRCSPISVPSVLVQRYELGPLLGQGGSAQVYWAWDRLLDRAVAVKVFAPGVAGPDRNRQDHELAALKRLVHPGLVELYEAGTHQGRTYLVMRLAQGPSLADRLRDMPLPVTTVAELGAEVADTLTYVHANGVTHRDIKPANVLLDEQDGALLADFGIALLVDCTRVTVSGAVIGTAAYMAPEQVRGELVGPPADVYSLGLVLLEALTGRREYPGTSVESACARLHRAPDVPENLPAGLTHILRRMITIESAERPCSAAAASALQVAATELGGLPTVRTELLPQLLDAHAVRPAALRGRFWGRILVAGAASSMLLAAGLTGLTTLDPTSGGATGIIKPPPAIATVLPVSPTGAAHSAAPDTGLLGRSAIGPTPVGATGINSAPPVTTTALPAPPPSLIPSVPSPATSRVPLPRDTPPARESSPATSPPPLMRKPVPQVDPSVPTQAVPPAAAHAGSGSSHVPHVRTPGSGTPSASDDSRSDLGTGSPAAEVSRHREGAPRGSSPR